MIDWQVNEEEQPLPKWVEEERPARRVRRWHLFAGLLLLLLLMMVGLFVLRWRLSERTEVMEGDLRAFIRHEEQQRLTEQVDELMVSNAPPEWQEAYQLSFAEAGDVQPVELTVEELSLEGTSAYATVHLDEARRKRRVEQVRFYRLVGQEWRRAPLFDAFWGEERQIELADEGITIVYPAREEGFVQRLVADLPILFEQWPAKKRPFTIKIEPTEFAPAVLNASQSDSMHEIVFNSPNLVTPSASRSSVRTATDGGVRRHASVSREVDGEGAIRLALADALLEAANLDDDTQQSALPGAPTFLAAIRNTFILRWALPDEAIPRQIWRERVKVLWKSPFLGQWKINRKGILLSRTWQPRLSEATALLMADYLYDQIGPQELQHLVKQLPTAQSWDRIFYPLTGRYTIELENEMRLGYPAKMTAHNINALPLSVTVLDMDAESGELEVEVTGQGRQLSIKTADGILNASKKVISESVEGSGLRYSARCAMLHKEVTITEGDWLEVGKTLQARQLTLSELEPAILPQETTLAPPDTLAYLAQQGDERGGGFDRFLALSEDGSTTDLMTLPSLISARVDSQSKSPWPSRFLITLRVPNCEQAWLFMYDPQQGVVDRRLTSFSGRSILSDFVWRPQEGDFILRAPTHSQKNQYWSASPGEPLRLLGEVKNWLGALGWLSERVVTLDEERKKVNIIDPKMGEVIKSIELASENAHSFMLSEDGKHLFYSYQLALTKKPTWHVANLESGQDKFLFSASDSEWFHSVAGRPSTDRLLLFARQQTNGVHIPTQLLLVDLNASIQPTLVMEIPFTQYVTSALACENDSVLMTIYQQGHTEVRMWQPDGNTKSLLRTDKKLTLLSCR